MGVTKTTGKQQWQLHVLVLKKIAKEKLGTGWQTELAARTGFAQSNISRMFGLKYSPSFPNYLILANALGVNFLPENKEIENNV